MIRKLTAKSSLDSLRKEARRWLKAIRDGEPQALARLKQALPGAGAAPHLRQVQQALAREHGVESWAALKLLLADAALARRTHAERLAEFLEYAILNYGIPPDAAKWDAAYPDDPSRREYAARILARHPEIASGSIHAAVICGDLAEVERLLGQDSRLASLRGGQRQWEPILYLAYGRLPLAAAVENSTAIARLLLDHGADPNAQTTDGTNPFTAVTGFIGEGERTPVEVPPHLHARECVRLLIERGANPFDTQALYNTSLWHDSTEWLELLYGCDERSGTTARWNEPHGREPGQLDYLLGNAVDRNHLRRAEWLLAHGANPRAPHAYTGRNLHTSAVLHGHTRMAELLANAGTQVEELAGREAFEASCLRLDIDTARRLLGQHPDYLGDPAALLTAARTGRVEVIAMLLDLGMPASIGDAKGECALHAVAWTDSVAAARLLVEHGAEIDARDRVHGATPLGWAIHFGKPELIDYLSRVSCDVASLARLGKTDRLQSLLREHPSLAQSLREDRTALFSLPEKDEDLAIEVAELLLSRGANPNARNGKGLTAADQAERNGMPALAQVLRDTRQS